MSNTITLTYNDEKYTLEFSRKMVENMERQGFDIQNIESAPLSAISTLIYSAFKKNHAQLRAEKIDEIWKEQGDKTGLIEALSELYAKPITELFDDDESKNATWTKSW